MRGEQTGDALHHHFARLVFGLADQRDARMRIAQRELAHPMRAGLRLAGAAAAENEPGGPGLSVIAGRGRALVVVRPGRPGIQNRFDKTGFSLPQQFRYQPFVGVTDQLVAQARGGVRRYFGARVDHSISLPCASTPGRCRRC